LGTCSVARVSSLNLLSTFWTICCAITALGLFGYLKFSILFFIYIFFMLTTLVCFTFYFKSGCIVFMGYCSQCVSGTWEVLDKTEKLADTFWSAYSFDGRVDYCFRMVRLNWPHWSLDLVRD
jgi:hypothetical protein